MTIRIISITVHHPNEDETDGASPHRLQLLMNNDHKITDARSGPSHVWTPISLVEGLDAGDSPLAEPSENTP